jgi:hypothetical protein
MGDRQLRSGARSSAAATAAAEGARGVGVVVENSVDSTRKVTTSSAAAAAATATAAAGESRGQRAATATTSDGAAAAPRASQRQPSATKTTTVSPEPRLSPGEKTKKTRRRVNLFTPLLHTSIQRLQERLKSSAKIRRNFLGVPTLSIPHFTT